MKVVELMFEDGEKWEIPLEVIAINRANYYKSKTEEEYNYEEEFKFVMEDGYEGIDWLKNNMNFEDFSASIKKYPVENKDKDWCNAESSIINTHDALNVKRETE